MGPIVQAVCDLNENTLTTEDRLDLIKSLSAADQLTVVEAILQTSGNAGRALRKLESTNKELHEIVQNLTRSPLHPAFFKNWVTIGENQFARVHCNGEERLVSAAPELDTSSLGTGSTVFLSAERNTVLSCATQPDVHVGQVGRVCDLYGETGVIVREHDQEITLERTFWLQQQSIKEGDQILWCPKTRLVWQVLSTANVNGVEHLTYHADQPPPRFAGYDEIRTNVITTFLNSVERPDLAAKYGAAPDQGALLLYGPPGCGKTLLARNLAHELKANFFVINASSVYSQWVGKSEQNVIDAFKAARKAKPALLFIDEVDAIGRVRGGTSSQYADRVVSVLLTQLEGAAGTPGIGVVAACNRVELVDPALRSRFGKQFLLGQPKRNALREIARIHFPETLPYRSEQTRERSIDLLVQHLTSPNANIDIATARFRNGKEQLITTRDLVSGRTVKQIAQAVGEAAFMREFCDGISGITEGDVAAAVENVAVGWRETLCVANVRGYVGNLPDDVDVVSVTPVTDRGRTSVYLHSGGAA
ncbi:MAG: AAA family ATPase [Proteobacteria bacterium]|nr:AAA family ATPase [Pseudomonadota bacterium]